MRYCRIFLVAVLIAGLCGCQSAEKKAAAPAVFSGKETQGVTSWTDKAFCNDPSRFQFAIISDLHGSGIPGVFEEAVKKINLMQPEFVVCVGDLIEGYTEDEEEIARQRDEFDRLIAPLDMRFFYLPGNHDITNMTMSKVWQERYGTTYYHFTYKNVLFLCLNSEDPPGSHMSKGQVAYVEKALADNPDVRWTIVLLHKPMWAENPKEWSPVEALLENRPHTIFAGHVHSYDKMVKDGHDHIRLAVTGGGSALRGPAHGEFNQIAWVTMTDAGPKIANLDLNGILDDTLATEPLAMIEAMAVKSWFAADSVVCTGRQFTKGEAGLHFVNPGGLPLTVKCDVADHDRLAVSQPHMDITLAPYTEKTVTLAVSAEKPLALAEAPALEYAVSAVYTTPDGKPMTSVKEGVLDMRYAWQGPEMLTNKSFDKGTKSWISLKKSKTAGDITPKTGAVKITVHEPDPRYAVVLAQPIGGVLKAGTDYRLTIKAGCLAGADKIGMGIRNGDTYAPMLIDSKPEIRHMISLTDKVAGHDIDFRLARPSDVASGILVFTFLTKNEIQMDEVSLRSVDKTLAAAQ